MKFYTTDNSSAANGTCYEIDAERGVRIEEYRGRVGFAELRSMTTAMASDPCWSPDHHALVDFREADLVMTANDVLRLALILRQEEHRSRGWMVFAVANSTAYGIVRMLGYWSRNTDRFRIFQNREDAEKWLERNAHKSPPGFRERRPAAPAAALRDAV